MAGGAVWVPRTKPEPGARMPGTPPQLGARMPQTLPQLSVPVCTHIPSWVSVQQVTGPGWSAARPGRGSGCVHVWLPVGWSLPLPLHPPDLRRGCALWKTHSSGHCHCPLQPVGLGLAAETHPSASTRREWAEPLQLSSRAVWQRPAVNCQAPWGGTRVPISCTLVGGRS